MTREPVDDATIEQLVRDVASGWTMPPVRLDAPSWRERVRSPRARRIQGAQTWLGRFGRAAGAAVALTLAGAMVAVIVTRPPGGPGKSSDPTGQATGPAPSAAAATALPKLVVHGAAPQPSTVLLGLEEGDFTLVDLLAGNGGAGMTGAAFGSVIRQQPDGTYVCLCARVGDRQDGQPTRAEISVERYSAAGDRLSSVVALTLLGDPDPRDGLLPERPPHVTFDLRFSANGRLGFVGWSVRKHPVWRNGITTIDLGDGHEVNQVALPDGSTGEGTTRRVVTAPRLLETDDGTVAIAREWYSWSPPASEGLNYLQGTETFSGALAGGRLSSLATLSAAEGCGERVLLGGSNADRGSWLACLRPFTNDLVVRRFDAQGTTVGDTSFGIASGIDGDPFAISPDGSSLYAWNPITATLARINLATGASTEAHGDAALVNRGPLAAVGSWLAPTAAAKSFLYGGLAVSPDGSRVYALGVAGSGNDRDISGSAGVFAFDTATMTSAGRWHPTADFISVAVSGDGRSVYAAGMPRVDATGASLAEQQASITVFDATTGDVRSIAGELGGRFLTFVDPVLR